MKTIVLALLVAFVSSEVSAGLGGVMRASSGKLHQVIAHGALIMLLCNGLSCAPSKVTDQGAVREAMLPEPMVAEQELVEKDLIEKSEVEGNDNTPLGAIDFQSVASYLAQKDTLTAEFYDNMLVHYLDDKNNNFVALITIDDDRLLARSSPVAQYEEIEIKQIAGVLIGGDPLIGSVVEALSTDILGINGVELPTTKVALRMVGTINQIFTSNYYQFHVRGFIIADELITLPLDETGLVFIHSDDLRFRTTGIQGIAQLKPLFLTSN